MKQKLYNHEILIECDSVVSYLSHLDMQKHGLFNPLSMTWFHEIFSFHDDVIIWKHLPRNWPFVQGIHRSPVNSPHKGQWRGALMFSLICAWINAWANNREAGDLRCHCAHYDLIVMLRSSGNLNSMISRKKLYKKLASFVVSIVLTTGLAALDTKTLMANFTNKVNPGLVNPSLKFNDNFVNLGLTSLVK